MDEYKFLRIIIVARNQWESHIKARTATTSNSVYAAMVAG